MTVIDKTEGAGTGYEPGFRAALQSEQSAELSNSRSGHEWPTNQRSSPNFKPIFR
ncbi:hypothetical protein EDE05_11780 [Neorhizobium sp. R1-B]|nr:hypothetical protein EDE05_11780 [Neorhizobium sp. R1-B]